MKPMPSQVGSLSPLEAFLRVDPLAGAAHHDPGRDGDDESVQNVERREQRQSARRQASDGQTITRQHRAEEHHRAEHVQEERAGSGRPAAITAPGFQIMSMSRSSDGASPASQRHRVAARVAQQGAQLVVGRVAGGSELLGELARACSWCLPPAPPSASGDRPRGRARRRSRSCTSRRSPARARARGRRRACRDRADADQRHGRREPGGAAARSRSAARRARRAC